MTLAVARLMDPKYLGLQSLQRLFTDAFEGVPYFPHGFLGMVDEIIGLIRDPDRAAVLIGLEDEEPKALLIILFPNSRLTYCPQILHFFNSGPTALRKKLQKAGATLVKARGYTKVWGVNGSGKPDSVWARTFRSVGPSKPIGGVVEFDLGPLEPPMGE